MVCSDLHVFCSAFDVQNVTYMVVSLVVGYYLNVQDEDVVDSLGHSGSSRTGYLVGLVGKK